MSGFVDRGQPSDVGASFAGYFGFRLGISSPSLTSAMTVSPGLRVPCLDGAAQRPGAELGLAAAFGRPFLGNPGDLQADLLGVEPAPAALRQKAGPVRGPRGPRRPP